jgi:hypothetical protein
MDTEVAEILILEISLFFILDYSDHSKTGQSGFQIDIFRTQFVSGFPMVGHLVLTNHKPNQITFSC